jgi:hypothetical protein
VSDPIRRREWAEFFEPLLELRSEEQLKAMADMNPPWNDNERFLAQTIDGLIANVVENNVKNWRMYCLTLHPDSIMMWSHYSCKHTGICLEFDTTGNSFGGARKVTYRDDFPTITPALLGNGTALTETILLTKSQHWSYEAEYRLLLRDRKLDPTFSLTCEDFAAPQKLPSGDALKLPSPGTRFGSGGQHHHPRRRRARSYRFWGRRFHPRRRRVAGEGEFIPGMD